MLCDVPFGGTRGKTIPPAFPSVKHHGGKSTEEKGDIQGRGGFFLPRRRV